MSKVYTFNSGFKVDSDILHLSIREFPTYAGFALVVIMHFIQGFLTSGFSQSHLDRVGHIFFLGDILQIGYIIIGLVAILVIYCVAQWSGTNKIISNKSMNCEPSLTWIQTDNQISSGGRARFNDSTSYLIGDGPIGFYGVPSFKSVEGFHKFIVPLKGFHHK